ncbi:hypothetical protein [Rhizobium rhizogenes]|uniref:hypothetical protein n=1 Tax=Rhizobium rhizogenes TaxID=359 RepID=UPI0015739842|nr:hypothetical protein [Rhizobium rhizogenes]NTF49087.1 hypothetical protein [Rhizobium rhizogenes]NTH06471.1 hypothetical protein [Rhizobium rhizogenes]
MLRRPVNLLFISILLLPLFTRAAQSAASEKPAVTIHIKLSDNAFGASGETFGLYALEDELEAAVGNSGELDGHEIGEGFFTMYVYGASPDSLMTKMAAILSRNSIPTGSYVELPDGPSGAGVKRMDIPLAEGAINRSKPASK